MHFVHSIPSILPFLSMLTLSSAQQEQPLQQDQNLNRPYCPLLGLDLPKAADPQACSSIARTSKQAKSDLDAALASNKLPKDKASFAANVFSTVDGSSKPSPLFEYYHTAVGGLNTSAGTDHIGPDTIFRIASVSKLFTVFTLLRVDGDAHFNTPVTHFLPELKGLGGNGPVWASVDWEDITVGELASQLAGVGRDYGQGELQDLYTPEQLLRLGAPPVTDSNRGPPCGDVPRTRPCTREELLRGITNRDPLTEPGTTPLYSNEAYNVLALLLPNLPHSRSQPFPSLLQSHILRPLNLSSTSPAPPRSFSNVAIPPSPEGLALSSAGFATKSPAGGIYSSVRDLAALGRAILTSELLPPPLTRRWLKPHAHTADPNLSVGAPWEIWRLAADGRLVDVYAKTGNLGDYGSVVAVVPSLGVGVAAASVAPGDSGVALAVASQLLRAFVPGMRGCAGDEAQAMLAGRYEAAGLNSSVVLSVDGYPGLGLDSWISNGSDYLALNAAAGGQVKPGHKAVGRLYASGLGAVEGEPGEAFRARFATVPVDGGAAAGAAGVGAVPACNSWTGVGGRTFGDVALDEVVISHDPVKNCSVLRALALRVDLKRVG